MISLDQARAKILDAIQPRGVETVPLEQALHRVVASVVRAQLDVPAFDNASVDGYALRTKDLAPIHIHPERAVQLRIQATVAAGEALLPDLPPGTCARIFTGAPLPPDADAVIMQEDTLPQPEGHVTLLAPVAPWEGVRFAAEDVRRGTALVEPGQRLQPAHLGLLAAAGVQSISAFQRPRISLFTTGNELVDLDQPVTPGKLPDSNRLLLLALTQTTGAIVAGSGRIMDSREAAMQALRAAMAQSDLVVTTGGVSVGDADILKDAFTAIGGHLDIWRIAIKPGKPFAWGRLEGCHWFGLPGNPVSAFVTWQLLVRPALRRLEGEKEVLGQRITARLAEPFSNPGDRLHFLRVHVDSGSWVRPTGTQSSHIQSSLALSNALLAIPPASTWERGREVEVEWL